MFPFLHLFIFLQLSLTCHGTPHHRTLLQQPSTNSSSCPLDFNSLRGLIDQIPKRPTINSTTQCQYIRQGLRLVQSEYLKRTNSFFPPLISANSCWKSYESLVDNYVPNFNILNTCGFQTFWISQGCMNITTRFEFESKVSPAALSNIVSACNQSLENNSPCATCTTSLSSLGSFLPGPSVGNVFDCASYPSIYAAAFANHFGPTDRGTAKCLFFFDITGVSSGKGKKNVVIVVVVVVCVLVIGLALFGYWFLWRKRKIRLANQWNTTRRLESNLSSRMDSISGSTTLVRFTIDEIKLATKNFTRTNIIGTGGYGNVYKGVLPGGVEVALKRFKNCSVSGDANFTHEVEVIASVRHVNLVALRGYCTATTRFEGHQRIIVCDLMKNGSLYDHLFGTGHEKLSWGIRQKVAIGTARGLAYLHYGAQPGIIHRDIKASNILLDESFEPKVADFGLAKFNPEGMSHLSTRVAGTIGYVAPEYALYGQLTERSDVYSFGVVLLELLSGKKAIIEFNDGQPTLVTDWAWSLVREGRPLDVLEDNIPHLGPPEVVEKYVLVAVLCSHPQLYARPTMDQVVNMLDAEIPVPTIPERPISLIADLDDIEKSVSSSTGGSGNLSTATGYQPYIFEREAPLADSDSIKARTLDHR
ncbi:probable LRR receptor-like serine/threonine-protein kinase RKF3 [Lycium ferocissimum]|uniref:probable LRR receptor-like serine/threonine-protein kinase RKF3 n=1 Tax=Lycium ferocissimum TaxID=112874 RepID=UPI00281506CF|nr:probable LRR receptor-like serine/threonine-protein kinase RKF3 [Lycium ferocissimum]